MSDSTSATLTYSQRTQVMSAIHRLFEKTPDGADGPADREDIRLMLEEMANTYDFAAHLVDMETAPCPLSIADIEWAMQATVERLTIEERNKEHGC